VLHRPVEPARLGFEDAGTIPNRRRVKFNGEIFQEGILESIVELQREQLAERLWEARCLELGKGPSSATGTDGVAGTRTGLRLVS